MDAPSQFSCNSRHGRNASPSASDRQLSESSNSYHHRHDRTSTLTTPSHHHPSKPATSFALRLDYHTRYPSPPPTQELSPCSPAFPYPSPSPAQPSIRDQAPNDRRHPPRLPSPTLHRPNGSSSSASNSPMITLPPISTHRPPIHRAVDQPPTPHHLEVSSTTQRKPSITQLSRDHPEQAPFRRHTLDSNHVSDPQIVSGPRKRTLSTLPSPIQLHSPGTQQISLPPLPPQLQPGQTSRRYSSPPLPQTSSRRYPSPPPLPPPRHDNPSPSTSQPPQISQSSRLHSQPATADDPSSVTALALDEAADLALEPLRLGFENVWTQTVQNVRKVMNKIQKDVNRLNSAERRKNVHLMRCLVSSSEKLKGQEWAVEELRRENGSLVAKALQNDQLRRENNQRITVIDSLNQENHDLRRENEELRKKNREAKEALTRATEFIFQYKGELAKVKADAETFRKCREASVLSANDQTMPTTDLREITRLHAETERERIFNDAVKQLRALTALEDSTTTRERDSEEVVTLSTMVGDYRGGSSSLEASASSVQQKSSTPPSTTRIISTDNEKKPKVEVDDSEGMKVGDVEMDGDNVTIASPITGIQSTDSKLTEEHQNLKDIHTDLEIQRQRQRQARRGPTPASPPISSSQPGSRKPSPVILKTGMKRDREQYEEGQVVEEDGVGIENPGNVIPEEQRHEDPVPGSTPAGTEAIHTDVDSEEGEIIIVERQPGHDTPKRRKGKNASTDEGQVTPILVPMTPNFAAAKNANPKALRRWEYYTHPSDAPSPVHRSPVHRSPVHRSPVHRSPVHPKRPFFTSTTAQQSPPPPQARLPKKLGINHMALLYKTEKEEMVCRICLSLEQNPNSTTADRRKAKTNTKKFPLNASWADLINHCQTEHAKACEDMEKLSPSQLAELKQRTSTR